MDMNFNAGRKYLPGLLVIFTVIILSSCTRTLGYGMLLWASDDPPIPSGTVLPVYIKSNIDQVWVAGIPEEYRVQGNKIDKFEIPLAKLELIGSKKKALQRAEEFAPYALSYAETLQDGLPIRESPDNNARRVYRLKLGEIIKILNPVSGVAAVGTNGDPLPGGWYKVLTEDGSVGYCFSYRLRIFDHEGGSLTAEVSVEQAADDPDLDRLLARTWSAESYGTMLNNRRLDLDDLRHNWGFDPGQETGIAQIRTKDVEKSFTYTAIRSTGTRSWRFEGSVLQMELRSDTTLAVQFTDATGMPKTLLFVALPTSVDDLIAQEIARREQLFGKIFDQGPVYSSRNYGTITFTEDGNFTWTGNDLLIPQVIPAAALGSGSVDMRLFVAPALSDRYGGAFTLRFNGINGTGAEVNFLYYLDNQGFRLEYVPPASMDGTLVSRRASSPLVLYFYKTEIQPSVPVDVYGDVPGDQFD